MRYLLALIIAVGLAACETAPTGPASKPAFTRADVIRGFDRVAFGREFADADSDRVLKYAEPIRPVIVHEPNDLQSIRRVRFVFQTIEGFYRAPVIERLETVEIRSIREGQLDPFNFVIYALGRDSYEILLNRLESRLAGNPKLWNQYELSRCSGFFGGDGSHDLRTFIIVDVDNPLHDMQECFFEEILQGLGLPDDDDGLIWSLFNDSNDVHIPGAFDNLLVSILYSDAIRPDMPRAQVQALVPAIVDDLWPLYQASDG
ncbi:DUF2927 domain-containing protein [Minwuia sp.]|uniref:DUF2927 domain-containing protein n=1 Tax=Minwuia sp. TaxID=2493630 RepID=UPI003A949E80